MRKKILLASASMAAAFWASGAIAQASGQAQSTPSPQNTDTVEEVVVTGSRVVSNGFAAPTPVTVLQATQLSAAQPKTLIESLVQVPALANSISPQQQGGGTTGVNAASFLNLRALGPVRTLTLIDGRRLVPTGSLGATNVSLIPTGLIQRVDIVTGGASSVYGSDAVAGVVNFITDHQFEGFKGEIQGTTSSRGDAQGGKFTATYGQSILDGRGRFTISGEYSGNDGIPSSEGRDWAQAGYAVIANPAVSAANPASEANPARLWARPVVSSAATYGGLIASGPLAGTQFLPGGGSAPFNFGSLVSATTMVGGDGVDGQRDLSLTAWQRRTGIYSRGEFDVTPNVTAFAEFIFGEDHTRYDSTYPFQTANAFTIFSDNAYLPNVVRARMAAAGVSNFRLGRINRDFGMTIADNLSNTYNGTVGFTAKLPDEWHLDGYFTHGQNNYRVNTENDQIYPNVYRAADAVVNPANNQIVCRSTLANPTNGCVPINLFGEGSPSQAAIAYVTGTAYQRAVTTQDAAALTVRGEPFSLPAGPVSLGGGIEYRSVETTQVVDPLSATVLSTAGINGIPASLNGQFGLYERTNPQPYSGRYDVREVFAETLLPLLREVPFAKSLDFNAAIRYTDYSTSGGATTWKAGLSYVPFSDLRLRVTSSKDIRAPNINELFTPPSQTASSSTVTDPTRGNASTSGVNVRTLGNGALTPEQADTTTIGAVFSPSWFAGFTMSIDYYDIRVEQAIAQLGAQQVINQCAAGFTDLCSLITRNSAGAITAVDNQFKNVAFVKTSGIDIEASYRFALADWNAAWSGNVFIRAIANHIEDLTTQNPGVTGINRAGDLGTNATPSWRGNISVSYDSGPYRLFIQERFIGSGLYDSTLTAKDISQNTVDGAAYTDLTASYRQEMAAGSLEYYVTANNLLDKDPPFAPSFFLIGTLETNKTAFDVIGRAVTAGVRFSF